MATGKYFISSMSTVLTFSLDGIDYKDPKEKAKIDTQVEKKVKEIVDQLKLSHTKFEDPDFGPNEKV